jgi:hypothetical protein
VGRPESRLALATNWPMNPVEPMIMTPSLASETLGVEPHMIFFFFFFSCCRHQCYFMFPLLLTTKHKDTGGRLRPQGRELRVGYIEVGQKRIW